MELGQGGRLTCTAAPPRAAAVRACCTPRYLCACGPCRAGSTWDHAACARGTCRAYNEANPAAGGAAGSLWLRGVEEDQLLSLCTHRRAASSAVPGMMTKVQIRKRSGVVGRQVGRQLAACTQAEVIRSFR